MQVRTRFHIAGVDADPIERLSDLRGSLLIVALFDHALDLHEPTEPFYFDHFGEQPFAPKQRAAFAFNGKTLAAHPVAKLLEGSGIAYLELPLKISLNTVVYAFLLVSDHCGGRLGYRSRAR